MLTEIEAGPRERIPRPSPKTELLTVTLAAVNDIEGSTEDDAGSNSSRRASIDAKEADESPHHSSFTDLSLTDDDSGTNFGSGSSIRRVRLPTGDLRKIDSPYVVVGSSPVVTTNESTNDVPSPLPISKESDIVTSDEREPKRQSGSGLRQGVEMKTARQMQGGTFRDRDVIVSATASCKQRRLVFAKKHDAKQAVAKRTVQPKRVLPSRPQISESPVKKKSDGDSLPADQTSTAATAAAAAAAAAATAAITSSGPYVQASQALTSQVAGLVSQLHALRDRQEADMTARQRRFQEQADRYADVRLGQLERLHERHADIQAQLARTATHSHPPPPPPPPVVSAPPQSLLPVDGDILATPLPRKVTPVPTRSDCLRTRQTVISDTDSSCLDGMEDGRKREEIVSIDDSSSLESATAVQTSAARRNENRFCGMEHRLELLKKQLADLRTRTTEWRQRNNGRNVASAPVFSSTIDQRWLDAEDILARCNESRRNLDDNLEAIRREHEARSLYNLDPFTGDGTLDSIRRDVARNVEAIRREIHVEIARESSSRRAVSFARDEQVDGSKTKKKKQNFARRTGSAYVRKLPSKRKEVATIDSKTRGKKTGNKPVKAPLDRKQSHFVPPTAVRHKTVAFEPRAAPAAARIVYPTAIPLSVPRQAWSDEAKSDATDDDGTSNRIDVAIQAGRSDGSDNADRVLSRLTLEALPHVSIDANESDQPTQRSDTASDVVRKFDHFGRVDAYPGNDDDDDDAGGDKAELQEDEEEIFVESEARLQETVELEGGRLPNVDRAAPTLTGQPPRVEGHFVVAAAEEQSNDVEQFAREWIERELKARVDVQHRPESGDVSVDESASFSDEEAALSSSIARIFAEARLSVDEDLVDRLKRAVVTDMVSKAWRRQTAAATGVEHEKNTPPLSSQSSSSTVATPLPTRSPSPATSVEEEEEEEDRVVQSQKVATPSVTPPPSPVDQEIPLRSESEREEEEHGDVLSPFKSPFIDQAVTTIDLTPSDTASSNKSSIPGDDVAQISTPRLSEEEKNDDGDESGGGGDSFVESENLETPSRQVANLVVAETQTSEHNKSVSLRSPTYSLSVSGTSSLTSSSAASTSGGDRPDHTTTALSTTDAEISEGEYLLVRPPPPSSPEATTAKANELSEGEFPASPGDVRLTKRPKGRAVSKEAFDGEQFQGDVRGFLEAFLEQSPEETALSATDSSSASLSANAKRGVNFARELVEVAQLGDENDVSLGEVIGAGNSKRADESEDLSYGEAVRPAVASEAIKEGVLFLASGSIDDGNSPGEIRRKVAQGGVGVETREEPSEMSAHSPGERPHAPTNNGRQMRSLFSKSARDRRPVRRQPGRNETAFLPSVVQVPSISRRVLVAAAAQSPAPDDDMAAASISDVKFSESFRGEDTYSEVSSLSYSGVSGQAD